MYDVVILSVNFFFNLLNNIPVLIIERVYLISQTYKLLYFVWIK